MTYSKLTNCACGAAGRYAGQVRSATEKIPLMDKKTGKKVLKPAAVHRYECTNKKCGTSAEHGDQNTAAMIWHNKAVIKARAGRTGTIAPTETGKNDSTDTKGTNPSG